MSRIKIMPESLSNKIAAGEVIERPSSVVKELIENAIDAHSSLIKVEIEKAGTKLIQVTDNGSGMDGDDVLLALEMHGTSKLIDEKDIFNINTMGFRGEALPSVAAISKFTIKSKTERELEGTLLKVVGGKFIESTPVGCARGTTIRVEELFFNIPARKKFLKSDATEEHHIQEIFMMLALIHPEISFQLIMDKKVILNTPASDNLNSRLRAFFGKSFANEMLQIDYKFENYHVHGYIAKAGFTKTTRKEQRTFVNKRVVESFAIYRGIRDGYATIAEKGRYSPCVLFLELPNSEVDINVHPAKREVRFKHEFQISNIIENAIKSALSVDNKRQVEYSNTVFDHATFSNGKVSLDSILVDAYKTYAPKHEPEFEFKFESKTQVKPDDYAINSYPKEDEIKPKKAFDNQLTDVRPMEVVEQKIVFDTAKNLEVINASGDSDSVEDENNFEIANSTVFPDNIIGILDNSYILCQSKQGLTIIDQHAAHERILFEKLLKQYGENAVSQSLLLPEVLNLSLAYSNLLLRNIKTFQQLGFDIEPMSKNSVMLNAVPMAISIANTSQLIEDILATLLEDGNTKTTATLELIARSACKAAVKFHDNITIDGAKLLLNNLRKCNQPTLCPHGRPTMFEISYSDLIKKFQR